VEARGWAFHLPGPAPEKCREPLVQTDDARLLHAGQRPPEECVRVPVAVREHFAGNWERAAAEPLPDHRRRVRRRMESSRLTRWLFTNGRFDITSAFGPLLLLLLLAAVFYLGYKLLTGGGGLPPPPAEQPHR
jgi:hypothetical protein